MICNPLLKNCEQVENPTAYTNNVLQTIISVFFIVGIIYFIWHFVMAAYHFISSEGDMKKVETAKNEILYALVGVAIIFCVFAVIKLIGYIFGISNLESLQITWPSL